MGRYFLYRLHPLSVGELGSAEIDTNDIFRKPVDVEAPTVESLLQLGGSPEPFLNGTMKFKARWHRMRLEQLFTEDIRDVSRVQDIRQIWQLSELLTARVSGGVNVAAIASDLGATQPTVANWILLLESIYFSYEVRPWHKNVASSISCPKSAVGDICASTKGTGGHNENRDLAISKSDAASGRGKQMAVQERPVRLAERPPVSRHRDSKWRISRID